MAEPSPLVKSTHAEMARERARTRATTTRGVNSAANGAVSRRVTAGSETTHRRRSASSGLAFRSSGSRAVGRAEQAERAQLGLDELPDVVGPPPDGRMPR